MCSIFTSPPRNFRGVPNSSTPFWISHSAASKQSCDDAGYGFSGARRYPIEMTIRFVASTYIFSRGS